MEIRTNCLRKSLPTITRKFPVFEVIKSGKIFYIGAIDLTCYFRHLKDVFARAGINVTKENKKEIDRVIHGIVGIEYKNCSATLKEVKKIIADSEEDFISELKKKISLF